MAGADAAPEVGARPATTTRPTTAKSWIRFMGISPISFRARSARLSNPMIEPARFRAFSDQQQLRVVGVRRLYTREQLRTQGSPAGLVLPRDRSGHSVPRREASQRECD